MDTHLEQYFTNEKHQGLRTSNNFIQQVSSHTLRTQGHCSTFQPQITTTAMTPNKPADSRFFNASNITQRHSFPLNPAQSTPIHYQYNTATDNTKANANQSTIQQDEYGAYLHPLVPQSFIDLKYQQFGYPNHHEFSENSLELGIPSQVHEFPASFNPREAASMHHREKVNNWIKRVPVYYLPEGQFWYSDCYPGVVPTSSSASRSTDEMDFVRFGQNFSTTGFEFDDSELFVDHEDVLEFQARKITKYVKKIYHLDQGGPTKMGNKSFVTADGFDRSHYSIDPETNLDITNTSYNLNLTEAFDQINNKNNLILDDDFDNFVMNNADDLDLERAARYTTKKIISKRAAGDHYV